MGVDATTLGIGVDSSGVRRGTEDIEKLVPAGKRAADSATEMERAMRRASVEGNVLGVQISNLINGVIHAAAKFVELGFDIGRYQDIAEKTMTNPAGLASLRTDADVAGMSIETLGLALNRMTLQLSRASDESKPAVRALEAINISVDKFKNLSPEQQYREIAVALSKYADSNDKVVVLQALMGRGGAEQLVMMKELAKGIEPLIKLTADQIGYADDLADAQKRTRSDMKQLAEFMATGALPAYEAVTSVVKDTIKEMLNFDSTTKSMDNSVVVDFAFGVGRAFAEMADFVRTSVQETLAAGKTLGAGAAILHEFFFTAGVTPEGKDQAVENIKAIGRAWKEDVDDIFSNTLGKTTLVSKFEEAEQKIRARMAAAAAAANLVGPPESLAGAGQSKIDSSKINESLNKRKDIYKDVMDKIQEFTAAQQLEIDSGEKLTAGQRLQIQLRQELEKLTGKGAEAKRRDAQAAIDNALAVERENISKEKAAKADEERRRGNRDLLSDYAREAEAADAAADAAQREADAYDVRREELVKAEIAFNRETASLLRRTAVTRDGSEAEAAANQLMRDRADALDRTADAMQRLAEKEKAHNQDAMAGATRAVKAYTEEVQNAGLATERIVGDAMRGTEDLLVGVFTRSEVDVRRFVTNTIAEFYRLKVIKPLLSDIFQALLMAWNGATNPSSGNESSPSFVGPPSSSAGSVSASSANRVSATAATVVNNYINIDSRSDQTQVAQLVADGVVEGQRQLVASMKAQGAI